MNTTTSRRPFLLFGAITLTIYAFAVGLIRALDGLDQPGAIAFGVTMDLVVLVPTVWYLLVVRRGRAPAVTVLPLAVFGMILASVIVPAEHHQGLRIVEALLIPLELGVLGWIVHRAAQTARDVAADADHDPVRRYHDAARGLVKAARPAAMVATELTMFHYALASWRSAPHVPVGTTPFSYHTRSGASGLAFGLGFLLVAEGLALHLWIHTWSPVLAWILSSSNVYALILILADARAAILRPILVGPSLLTLRGGLRWTLQVERDNVVDVTRTAPDLPRRNIQFIGEPTVWIVFDEAVTLRGMYGSRKEVRAVGLSPDDTDGLREALLRTGHETGSPASEGSR